MMVWRSIIYYGADTIVIADGHMNSKRYIHVHVDVLDGHLWVVTAKHFTDRPCLLQEDNAPCYQLSLCENWKKDNTNDLSVLTWPTQSPDPSPLH